MEKELQVLINADLRKHKIGFWHREKSGYNKPRSHNTFKFDPKDKEEKKKSWPDLLIMKGDSDLFYVEVKTKTGKLSEEQISFFNWSKSMGYRHYVVKDLNEWELVKKLEAIA